MWHLTRLINYPDGTEVETLNTYEQQHEVEHEVFRLLNRLSDNKFTSLVLTIVYTK